MMYVFLQITLLTHHEHLPISYVVIADLQYFFFVNHLYFFFHLWMRVMYNSKNVKKNNSDEKKVALRYFFFNFMTYVLGWLSRKFPDGFSHIILI